MELGLHISVDVFSFCKTNWERTNKILSEYIKISLTRHVVSQENGWLKLTFFLKCSTNVSFSQSQVVLWIQNVPPKSPEHLLPNAPFK